MLCAVWLVDLLINVLPLFNLRTTINTTKYLQLQGAKLKAPPTGAVMDSVFLVKGGQ